MFRADASLAALEGHAPDIIPPAREVMGRAGREGARIWPDVDAFARSPDDSVDYAVMEKADRVAVVCQHGMERCWQLDAFMQSATATTLGMRTVEAAEAK